MKRLLLIVGILGMCQQWAAAQATQAVGDAGTLYLRAVKMLDANKIMPPSSLDSEFPAYPPYPEEWYRLEKADFATNAEARGLAHSARAIDQANGPPLKMPKPDISYLIGCRALANDLADAALYQHLQGDDAAAVETLRDLWHLADALENQSDKTLVSLLVGMGIRALSMNRFEIITASIALTKDPGDVIDLQTSLAGELIGQLIKHKDARTEGQDVFRADPGDAGPLTRAETDKFIETLTRCNSERDLGAISLACHLCRFDTGRWPKSLDDLHAYLPGVPIDPWGNGKQTFEYVLVKGGLPDGSDRPLVYSRCLSKDGMFYRIDGPEYGFYGDDGSSRPKAERKHGGQFRDVAAWTPPAGPPPTTTTRPVE